jgi:hypothetical protein
MRNKRMSKKKVSPQRSRRYKTTPSRASAISTYTTATKRATGRYRPTRSRVEAQKSTTDETTSNKAEAS